MRSWTTHLAAIALLGCAAAGAWGWALHPETPARWLFVILFFPALWGFLELAQGGSVEVGRKAIMSFHHAVIACAGILLTLSIASGLALEMGLLGGEHKEILARFRGVALGVALAGWGNYLPKVLSPWKREEEPFDWQGVHRFCGWVSALSGLALVPAWLFLPLERAGLVGKALVITMVVLCVGRKWLSLATHTPPRVPDSAFQRGRRS